MANFYLASVLLPIKRVYFGTNQTIQTGYNEMNDCRITNQIATTFQYLPFYINQFILIVMNKRSEDHHLFSVEAVESTSIIIN